MNINGTLRSAPYDVFVTKITDKIDENVVDKTVKNWILTNFSTMTSFPESQIRNIRLN